MLFTMDRIASDVAAFGSGVKGHVRLVATVSAIAESLLDDIASFMREPANRNIKVDIEERFSRDLVRQLREGSASVGVCWDNADLRGPASTGPIAATSSRSRCIRSIRSRGRKSLRFEQTLDHEHVGLPPSTAVHTMLQRAAARVGRTVSLPGRSCRTSTPRSASSRPTSASAWFRSRSARRTRRCSASRSSR